MANSPAPDLVKVTEIFLIPCSFLVAALGTADSNPHRAAVSLVGLIISVLWWICSREALLESRPAQTDSGNVRSPRRTLVLSWLSLIFMVGWFLSAIVHAMLWNQPLGV